MTTTRGTTLTTTMGVINRVHGNATNCGPASKPAGAPRFPDGHILVIDIADLSDSSHAVKQHHPHFAGRELHLGILAFFGHELGKGTGTAGKLPTLPDFQLDVMDDRAQRNGAKRKCIARLDIGIGTGNDTVTHLEIKRSKDVALFTVRIVEQSNPCASVGVVFDARNFCRDLHFIPAEIDYAVLLLMSTTDMTGSDPAEAVTAAGLLYGDNERLLGG
ncbi:hypothetical protein SE37_11545 [Geobacter soli]|uniref:Uncharacterized protein n=1 Tax=Geobacter soli TaxID=1510391 RepID=A0A0C1QR32_9BACT|nr:hypothetical protein SE37_11545 [Geobacter soli]